MVDVLFCIVGTDACHFSHRGGEKGRDTVAFLQNVS